MLQIYCFDMMMHFYMFIIYYCRHTHTHTRIRLYYFSCFFHCFSILFACSYNFCFLVLFISTLYCCSSLLRTYSSFDCLKFSFLPNAMSCCFDDRLVDIMHQLILTFILFILVVFCFFCLNSLF